MAVISATCPHCHTEYTSFRAVYERQHVHQRDLWTVYCYCNHCDFPLSVVVKPLKGPSPLGFEGDLQKSNGLYMVVQIFPAPLDVDVPEFLPKNISSYYEQAADNLRRKHWDASGVMCRKVLDVTAAKDSKKSHLRDKINELEEKRLITPQLMEWSHSIRLDGNDAAHEEEYTEEEAKALFDFMHMFVLYFYTMPGMLEARKHKVE